jgi:hypothetical protein
MTGLISRMACGVVLLLPAAAIAPARAEPPKLPVPAVDQSAVGQRGYFYVGGKYVGEAGKQIMQGQIYAEVLAPSPAPNALWRTRISTSACATRMCGGPTRWC